MMQRKFVPMESSVHVEVEVLNVDVEYNLLGTESADLRRAKESMERYIVANATVFGQGKLAGQRVVMALLELIDARSALEPAAGHEGIDGIDVNAENVVSLDVDLAYDGVVDVMRAVEAIEVREGVDTVETGLAEERQVVLRKLVDNGFVMAINLL
jgi:hypothetical protein